MNVTTTERGFEVIKFQDRNGEQCSLQASSLATEEAVWLGCNEVVPLVLVQDEGWKPVPLPDDALIAARMPLTRAQVAELLPHLMRFAREGRL